MAIEGLPRLQPKQLGLDFPRAAVAGLCSSSLSLSSGGLLLACIDLQAAECEVDHPLVVEAQGELVLHSALGREALVLHEGLECLPLQSQEPEDRRFVPHLPSLFEVGGAELHQVQVPLLQVELAHLACLVLLDL